MCVIGSEPQVEHPFPVFYYIVGFLLSIQFVILIKKKTNKVTTGKKAGLAILYSRSAGQALLVQGG